MKLTKKQIMSLVKVRDFRPLMNINGYKITKKRISYMRKQQIMDVYNLNIISEILTLDCLKNIHLFLN
jgi:hypothetical protein